MKSYIYSAATLMTLSMLTLTSCQDEMEQVGQPVGRQTLLRVTANRGDATTRTTLEHDGNGGLTCKWEEGDQLMVVDESTGKKIGVVTLVSEAGFSDGVFEGNVELTGKTSVSLVYLGTAQNAETYSVEADSLAIDLTAQDGTFASLTKKDVLTSSSYVVENNYTSQTVEIANVSLTRQLAFGYFTLDFGSENVTLAEGDVITISGETLKASGKVNFKNGGSVANQTAGSITITKTKAGNDFYVTMLPSGEVTPTFTVEKNGVTYNGSLRAHNWKSGEYVRAQDYSAVAVTMEKEGKIDDSIFGVKWAEYNTQSIISGNTSEYYILSYIPSVNLKDQGYSDDYVIDHAENPEISYYQWDREFGFIGINGSGNRYPQYGSQDNYWAPIPGSGYNMGWQFNPGQYWYSTSQCTNNNIGSNFYILYYPSKKDWLSSHTSTKWESKMGTYKMSAIPTGFQLPEKEQWEKLLLNNSGTQESIAGFVYDHEADVDFKYRLFPVKILTDTDGNSILFSISREYDGDENKIYVLDIRKLNGSYEIADLKDKEDVVINCISSLRLAANGYLSSKGVTQNYGTEGYYWTSTSSSTSGEAYAYHFVIDPTNGYLKTEIVSKPRKEVYCVRCAYNN